MIYYNKMIMIRLNKNVAEVVLLVYKNLYIKSFLKSYSFIVLDFKDKNEFYLFSFLRHIVILFKIYYIII